MSFASAIIDSKVIFNRLQDDESRLIFKERMLFSLTNDYCHIRNIVENSTDCFEFNEFMNGNDDIYIFGAGTECKRFLRVYSKIKGIIDNDKNKIGSIFCGLPVYGVDEIVNETFSGKVLIVSWIYAKDMKKQLLQNGMYEKNIFVVKDHAVNNLKHRQYFSLKKLVNNGCEVFCDVGVMDGGSSIDFIEWCENRYSKIYCFEPDKKNIIKTKTNLNSFIETGKVELIEKGLYSSQREIGFKSLGTGSSEISDSDVNVTISVDKLDNLITDDKVSFIKMDIEGAEYDALLGAANTIKNNRPKLAICIYHKPEDVIELSKIILEYNSDYKLYIRHYSLLDTETVLYAI